MGVAYLTTTHAAALTSPAHCISCNTEGSIYITIYRVVFNDLECCVCLAKHVAYLTIAHAVLTLQYLHIPHIMQNLECFVRLAINNLMHVAYFAIARAAFTLLCTPHTKRGHLRHLKTYFLGVTFLNVFCGRLGIKKVTPKNDL